MGISQLIYGPCSDRFGRKPVILIALGIFFVGSLWAGFSYDIGSLLGARVVQGIGMGGAFSVASGILGDVYAGPRLARMTTFSSMIYSISPLLAPVIGGYLEVWLGWHSNFYFMAILTFIIFLAFLTFVFETNQHKNPHALNPKVFIVNYLKMLIHARLVFNDATLTLSFGITVAFNILGPFLMQNVLHMRPDTYGLMLLILGAAYFIGTSCNNLLLQFFSKSTLVFSGQVLMAIFCLALLLSGGFGWFSITSVTLWMTLIIFGSGFIFPNCFANALEMYPKKLGAAAALVGASALLCTAIISAIVAVVPVYSATTLAYNEMDSPH